MSAVLRRLAAPALLAAGVLLTALLGIGLLDDGPVRIGLGWVIALVAGAAVHRTAVVADGRRGG